ncbi:MAG: hypothetical protein AAF533_14525 [Acidobacteriota bacterium]
MKYLFFVFGDDDSSTLHEAPVDESDAAYLDRVAPLLEPLPHEDYSSGPMVILQTGAKSSYVLDGERIYWCVEWDPGLVVIRFSPDGDMAWTALRSPVPHFGGRDASEEEMDDWDEDADNPQYNLIFRPWDAQFEEIDREGMNAIPADAATAAAFEAAVATANRLNEEQGSSTDDDWRQRCLANLEARCGDGIRLS